MLIPYHDDNPTHRTPFVTVGIIVINTLCFLLLLAPDEHEMRLAAAQLGFVPKRLTNYLAGGQPVKVDLYRDRPQQDDMPPQKRFVELQPTLAAVVFTMVTSMFMHAGFWHLGGNMLFFWIFGNNIEDRLGHITFALFYLIGGGLATLCHWMMVKPPMDTIPMVGASGAVAVILGAYLVTYPRAKVRTIFLLGCIPLFFEVPALVVLGLWIVNDLISVMLLEQGFATSVALWAHIGGFFIGALIMPILAAGTPEPTEDWKKEAEEQFHYEAIHPEERRGPATRAAAQQTPGVWWEEQPRREMPEDDRGQIWWEDELR